MKMNLRYPEVKTMIFTGTKKRGVGLILVLLVIAGVLVIVLATQRLALVQFSQSTAEEDNIFAYYAAKAAVEDGLLRFRHERNSEIPDGKVHRFALSLGSDLGEVDESEDLRTTSNYQPNYQYYDLKIKYRTGQIGDFSDMTKSPILTRDNVVTLTGFEPRPQTGEGDSTYYLNYAFKFEGNLGQNCLVQLIQTRILNDGNRQEYEPIVVRKPPVGDTFNSAATANLLIAASTGGANTTAQLRIRPVDCDIRYALQTVSFPTGTQEAGSVKFDGLKTYITAIGYYGQARRTLVAEIDRSSGTLLNIFDFGLYAGGGDIKPR